MYNFSIGILSVLISWILISLLYMKIYIYISPIKRNLWNSNKEVAKFVILHTGNFIKNGIDLPSKDTYKLPKTLVNNKFDKYINIFISFPSFIYDHLISTRFIHHNFNKRCRLNIWLIKVYWIWR